MLRFDRLAKENEQIFDIRPLADRTRQWRILAMESTTVIRFGDRQARETRISRAMDARRRLADLEERPDRSSGRAWINGLEVGGTDRRFQHLSVFHD
jgi:hypothetical protein